MSKAADYHSLTRARKAVLLARVSSKEQEDGYSIDAQKYRLETYCLRHDLDIIKTFEITESSTNGDREKFMELITFIKTQKQPIALVADKVDRVQRSFKEYPLLDGLIQESKIELHFNTENYVIHKDSVSQERLMWSMGVIMAQSYIDSMRDNVKRSIDQKIRMGEWIAMAPIGYLNTKDERGRSTVTPDPERDYLIQRLFEEHATGAYTLSELTERAKSWNLTNSRGKAKGHLNRSHIYQILNNPFYYGDMRVKGKLYPHNYIPLITLELFEQCQRVFKSHHKKPFKYGKKEFVFRGLITCSTTGKVVTADTKTKTYPSGKTAQWTYLRCWNPDKPGKIQWVKEEVVLEQVKAALKSLYIEPQTLQSITQYVRDTDKTERQFHKQQIENLFEEQRKLQERLEGLMDLVLDGLISKDEYENKKYQLRKKLRDAGLRLEDHNHGDANFKDTLLALLSMAANAYKIFEGSTTAEKRRFLNFVFANLELKGSTLCYTFKKPFDLFAQASTCEEWRALVDSMRTSLHLKKAVQAFPVREYISSDGASKHIPSV